MYRKAGNVFKAAREARGKRMIDLAKRMKVQRAYLCRVERGVVALGRKNFRIFARAYGLTVEEKIQYVTFLFGIA